MRSNAAARMPPHHFCGALRQPACFPPYQFGRGAERRGRPQLKLAFSYSLASEYDKTTFPVASSGNKKCCKLFFGSELVQNMTKLQKNVHAQSLEQLHKYQLLFSVVSAEVEDAVDAVRSLAHCDTYGLSCNHSHKTFIINHN